MSLVGVFFQVCHFNSPGNTRQLELDNKVIYGPRHKKKSSKTITEIWNTHICLELNQKSLTKRLLVIHTNLLWTDFVLVAVQTKTLEVWNALKANYLGIITSCLDKTEHFYADSVHCIFCLNNLALVRICSSRKTVWKSCCILQQLEENQHPSRTSLSTRWGSKGA